MATDKQVEANGRNALKSTGPRTEAGKTTSSRNAVRHGLTAEQVVLEGEDRARFDALRSAINMEFAPEGPVAVFLAERLVGLIWRLGRVAGFEAGLLDWIAHQQAEAHDTAGVAFGEYFFSADRRALAIRPGDGNPVARSRLDQRRRVGRTLEAALNKTDPLSKLGRYESHLMKQVEKTLAALRRSVGRVRQQGRAYQAE